MRRREQEVEVRHTIEVDVVVTCVVTPGDPRHGEPAEVEIVRVESEDGADLSSLTLDRSDREVIEENALRLATDAEEDRRSAAVDDEIDRRRDERRGL